MNFVEAIKTGRPFRRPGKNNFGEERKYYNSVYDFIQDSYQQWSFHGFPFEEWFKADDWETLCDHPQNDRIAFNSFDGATIYRCMKCGEILSR